MKFALIPIAVFIVAWQLVVDFFDINELILPTPHHVVESLIKDRTSLFVAARVTATEVAIGLAAASLLGVIAALAMHRFKQIEAMLHPLIVGSQAIPILVVAPLFIFVFGFGFVPKLLIVMLGSFFPITINCYDGLRMADNDARGFLQSIGASRWQIIRLLEFPSALSSIFTGLKVAAAISVIAAVVAEWAGSDDGLGHSLLVAGAELNTARAFAATAILFVMAIAAYGLFSLGERKFTQRN